MKSIVLGIILLLTIVSIVLLGYVMYSLANTKQFEYDTLKKEDQKTPTADTQDLTVVKTKGDAAPDFWENNKTLLYTPTIMQTISFMLLGLVFYLS